MRRPCPCLKVYSPPGIRTHSSRIAWCTWKCSRSLLLTGRRLNDTPGRSSTMQPVERVNRKGVWKQRPTPTQSDPTFLHTRPEGQPRASDTAGQRKMMHRCPPPSAAETSGEKGDGHPRLSPLTSPTLSPLCPLPLSPLSIPSLSPLPLSPLSLSLSLSEAS